MHVRRLVEEAVSCETMLRSHAKGAPLKLTGINGPSIRTALSGLEVAKPLRRVRSELKLRPDQYGAITPAKVSLAELSAATKSLAAISGKNGYSFAPNFVSR